MNIVYSEPQKAKTILEEIELKSLILAFSFKDIIFNICRAIVSFSHFSDSAREPTILYFQSLEFNIVNFLKLLSLVRKNILKNF